MIFEKNVFFGVKRDRIQNRTGTWKQGKKRVVNPQNTQYSAKILRDKLRVANLGWRAAAARLKPLAAARPRLFGEKSPAT